MDDTNEWLDGTETLFTSEGNPWLNACAGFIQGDRIAYPIGYRLAAEHLFEYIAHYRQGLNDTLLLPIAYLWRQYLELQLKQLIDCGRRLYKDEGGFPPHHNLRGLWTEARTYLEQYQSGAPETRAADRLIEEFSQIDPGSFDFRYPLDKKGAKKTLERVPPLVNLGNLNSGMKRLANFLDAAGAAFTHGLDMKYEGLSLSEE